MRKVHLYGHLRKKFGATFELAVNTPGEALRALNTNFPGDFIAAMKEGYYRIVRGDRKKGMHFDETEVDFNLGSSDLHIIPVLAGSARSGGGGRKGGGGAIKIVLGVALIGAAIFFSGGTLAGLAAPVGGGLLGGITYGNIAVLGLVLALSGVASMMSPKEKPKQETQKSDSFTFSGPQNQQEQGGPIPLIYGQVKCGSLPVSAGYDIEPLAI